MPRGRLGGAQRRNAVQALRFEQLCLDTQQARRTERARQLDVKRRVSLSGWTELSEQIAVLDIQIEMQVMELRLVNQDRASMGLPPIDILPPDGGLGDMRHPDDDWRNYQ